MNRDVLFNWNREDEFYEVVLLVYVWVYFMYVLYCKIIIWILGKFVYDLCCEDDMDMILLIIMDDWWVVIVYKDLKIICWDIE